MSLLNRVSIDPEIVHGRPTVRSTRMRVTDVLSLLAAGANEAEIPDDYPPSDDIRACLAYAAAQADHPIVTGSAGGASLRERAFGEPRTACLTAQPLSRA